MKIYDISWPLDSATTAYKDKKIINIAHTKTFEQDAVRETMVTLGAHSGTHVDAPSHFISDGTTIDQMDLSHLIGHCKVFDMSSVTDGITKDHIENLTISAGDIVLFKTSNSALPTTQSFNPQFVYLEMSGAECLVERKVRAVGIDYLGIERNQPDHQTHIILFKHDIAIIEGLRLADVPAGSYFLCCLPLHMIGTEAAPARAVLIDFQ